MKFAFIAAERAFPVTIMCGALSVSRSGYYALARRKPSLRAKRDEALKGAITEAHRRSRGTYGSPRVHRELRAAGHRVGKKRVDRLMRAEGLAAKRRRRFRRTTSSNHALAIAPNVLARGFAAPARNRAWAIDVTYVWTHEGPGRDPRPLLEMRRRMGDQRNERPHPRAKCAPSGTGGS